MSSKSFENASKLNVGSLQQFGNIPLVVTVNQFGAVGNGTTNNVTAFQAADSAGNFEVPAGVYRLSSNITLNSTLQFMPGARLLADSGVTVTLNERPVADPTQIIFDGAGTYAFGGDISKYDNAPVRWFRASGSTANTLATTTASNPVVTLNNAIDFSNGEQIAIEHAGPASTLTAPTITEVSASGLNRQGLPGSTTYSYKAAAVDESGSVSAASAAVTIINGNAELGTINSSARALAFNLIRWNTTATGAALWRSKSGGAYQLIGVFGLGQSDSIANGCLDAGLPEITIPWIPATPPTTALAGRLVTRIVSGEGTTSLTLQNAPSTSGSSLYARHDDTVPLNTVASLVNNISIPTGTYNVSSLEIPNTVSSISGNGYGSVVYGWGARTAVVNVQCSTGFSASNLKVDSTAWHNQIGLQLNGGLKCRVENCSTSGNLPIFLVDCAYSLINNNILENWIDSGIFDLRGNANTIQNNFITAGCNAIPQNAAAIHTYLTNSDIISNNRTLGKCVYAIKVEAGNQNLISNNWSYNTWAETHHITGSASGNRIVGNTMYGGDLKMDYAISISNDNRPNCVMYGNEISGNFIYQCGTSAIAVCEFGGANPQIRYTTIKGNTVYGASQNSQPNTPEIFINGSHVENTYVSDHTTFSYAAINYVVEESAAGGYGLPNNTQVGTIFGDGAPSGLTLLTGTGSSKLTGGTTGK
jgi:hypothetical protein